MKTTIVPAQVTTVEDKIAGNLGFTQLLLLVTPVFLGAAVFVVLPPLFKVTVFKTALVAILAVVCILLSIRIKGVIVLNWMLILLRYNNRPRHYIYNKNDSYLRDMPAIEKSALITAFIPEELPATMPLLEPMQLIRAEMAVDDPRAKFNIRADRKGVLRAYIHEIKEKAV